MFPEYLKLVILSYRLPALSRTNLLNVVTPHWCLADIKVQLDQPTADAQTLDFQQY